MHITLHLLYTLSILIATSHSQTFPLTSLSSTPSDVTIQTLPHVTILSNSLIRESTGFSLDDNPTTIFESTAITPTILSITIATPTILSMTTTETSSTSTTTTGSTGSLTASGSRSTSSQNMPTVVAPIRNVGTRSGWYGSLVEWMFMASTVFLIL